MSDHKYLHIFTAEMDFLKLTACLNQTPVTTFQRDIPECNFLYSVILNLQDRLGDLRVSSLFRVYVTKKYFFKQDVNQYIRSTIVWNLTTFGVLFRYSVIVRISKVVHWH